MDTSKTNDPVMYEGYDEAYFALEEKLRQLKAENVRLATQNSDLNSLLRRMIELDGNMLKVMDAILTAVNNLNVTLEEMDHDY